MQILLMHQHLGMHQCTENTRKAPPRFFFATEIDFGTETCLRPCLSLFWPLSVQNDSVHASLDLL